MCTNTELQLFKNIADWITEIGLDRTTTGNYYVCFSDIAEIFRVSVDWIKKHTSDIEDYFDYDVVSECEIDHESFGMWFYLEYCCEHCGTYQTGNRCYEECSACDCWDDNMNEETDEYEDCEEDYED